MPSIINLRIAWRHYSSIIFLTSYFIYRLWSSYENHFRTLTNITQPFNDHNLDPWNASTSSYLGFNELGKSRSFTGEFAFIRSSRHTSVNTHTSAFSLSFLVHSVGGIHTSHAQLTSWAQTYTRSEGWWLTAAGNDGSWRLGTSGRKRRGWRSSTVA